MGDRCLLFFVKNPERGPVKSRLASAIGEAVTRDIYRNFVLDMLSKLEKEALPFLICFYPEDALSDLKVILGENHCYLSQKGDDLGQKMEHCFYKAFAKGFHRVILIGSDAPDLPSELIGDAFSLLNGSECVIGPSIDGGYYLVGFRSDSFLPEAFRSIQWSTDKVLVETTDILRKYHTSTHLLSLWRDVDTVEDLKHFFEKNKDTTICPRTMNYLRTTGLFPLNHSA